MFRILDGYRSRHVDRATPLPPNLDDPPRSVVRVSGDRRRFSLFYAIPATDPELKHTAVRIEPLEHYPPSERVQGMRNSVTRFYFERLSRYMSDFAETARLPLRELDGTVSHRCMANYSTGHNGRIHTWVVGHRIGAGEFGEEDRKAFLFDLRDFQRSLVPDRYFTQVGLRFENRVLRALGEEPISGRMEVVAPREWRLLWRVAERDLPEDLRSRAPHSGFLSSVEAYFRDRFERVADETGQYFERKKYPPAPLWTVIVSRLFETERGEREIVVGVQMSNWHLCEMLHSSPVRQRVSDTLREAVERYSAST